MKVPERIVVSFVVPCIFLPLSLMIDVMVVTGGEMMIRGRRYGRRRVTHMLGKRTWRSLVGSSLAAFGGGGGGADS